MNAKTHLLLLACLLVVFRACLAFSISRMRQATFLGRCRSPRPRPCPRLQAARTEYQYALLFDSDGVILETEELHRQAYNIAFKEFELTIDGAPVEWSVEYYDVLQNTVGGGKPKMFFHFRNTTNAFPASKGKPAPVGAAEQQALIDAIQTFKTATYKSLLEKKAIPRPGVLSLMDEALADPSIAVGVCSAATKESAQRTLEVTLGPDRVSRLNVCLLGDDVPAKKPDPLIYTTARESLNMPADRCVVIEDSIIGLRAAIGAGMRCVITYTSSTASCDFYGEGAVAKVPDLESRNVQLVDIFGALRDGTDILEGKKDPISVGV